MLIRASKHPIPQITHVSFLEQINFIVNLF